MRKEKRSKGAMYVAIFIAVIMITSVLGYIFGDGSQESMTYGKHDFYKKNLKWVTKINGNEVAFDAFPAEVELINLSENAKNKILDSKMIYVTYNPNQTNEELGFAQFDLNQKLMLINIYVSNGMTAENKYGISVITCENATQFVPVIVLEYSSNNIIKEEGSCIILDGDPILLKDRLLYSVFGVI
jgi:hypothetical protein